jgi:hypothetical protein
MAVLNLSGYGAVQSNLFVRIPVNQYRTTPTAAYTSTILRFSDRRVTTTVNSETYTGLGRLVDISGTNSELRSSSMQLSISVSGIPNTSIAEIVNSKIKGCPVIVYRVLFNPVTGNVLPESDTPLTRFRGYITNYTLTEDYDIDSRTSSNTITFNCSSVIDVLQNKISGRRTNPVQQKLLYPNDKAFDRVPTLKNSAFDFGSEY